VGARAMPSVSHYTVARIRHDYPGKLTANEGHRKCFPPMSWSSLVRVKPQTVRPILLISDLAQDPLLHIRPVVTCGAAK